MKNSLQGGGSNLTSKNFDINFLDAMAMGKGVVAGVVEEGSKGVEACSLEVGLVVVVVVMKKRERDGGGHRKEKEREVSSWASKKLLFYFIILFNYYIFKFELFK